MKKFTALILSLAMLTSAFMFSAGADEKPSSDTVFSDVSKENWFFEAVEYCWQNGIFSGMSETVFAPGEQMSRAMFVTALARTSGENLSSYTESSFSDVDENVYSWAIPSIEWAKDNELVTGTGADSFSPSAPVTREQMATFLFRFSKYCGIDVSGTNPHAFEKFHDAGLVSEYAKEGVTFAATWGIINGSGTIEGAPVLNPRGNATRAEVAQIIYGYKNARINQDYPVGDITLAGQSIRDYCIIYGTGHETLKKSSDWGSSDKAAEIMRRFIFEATGYDLPVYKDSDKSPEDKEILIGKTDREGSEIQAIERASYADEQFSVTMSGSRLVITSSERYSGTMYGVIRFLREYIGWRFIREGNYCEPSNLIEIPADIDFRDYPDMEYRTLYTGEYTYDPYYYGSESACGPCNIVHTIPAYSLDYSSYITYDEYGNPDYRRAANAIDDGWADQSLSLGPDPCLCDETVITNIINNVRIKLTCSPAAEWLYVSQGDGWIYCTCEKCSAVYAEEQSRAGTYVRLINRIADELRDEFPNVKYATLAYKQTIQAPKMTKLCDEGIVIICTDMACHSHAIYDNETCWLNQCYKRNVDEWHEAAKTIYVWDYLSNLIYYTSIFPNIYTMVENFTYFGQVGVKGCFAQFETELHGDFTGLRAYLYSEFTFDTKHTYDEWMDIIDEYLKETCGTGWTFIREYIDDTERLSSENEYSVWPVPDMTITQQQYFENRDYWNYLFDRAIALADNAAQRNYLETMRLQLDFTELFYTYESSMVNGTSAQSAEWRADCEAFYNGLMSHGCRLPVQYDFSINPVLWKY